MQPLNFCRQVIKQFRETGSLGGWADIGTTNAVETVNAAEKAVKFCLPDGGKIINDTELRGLDGGIELHLPFNLIALEFIVTAPPEEGRFRSSKRVVIAEEKEEFLECRALFWADDHNQWRALPDFDIPKKDYMFKQDGSLMLRLNTLAITLSDVQQEVEVLLDFINALQCSNVDITKEKGRKNNKSTKNPLPFDDYHFLTITRSEDATTSASGVGPGARSHRSPREHLRRGHIRRLPTGKKVWVSAAVICAGQGGRVHKDYRLTA